MTAAGEGKIYRIEEGGLFEAGLQDVERKAVRRKIGRTRDLGECHAPVGAADREFAVGEFDVLLTGLEQVAVTGRFCGLDILVNNAGVFLGMSIEEASLADWHRLCGVNLTGVLLGTKLALPALRDSAQKSPHGSAIVNLASVAGLVGSSGDPLYSMTKGGVTLFTKSAALEFARKGYRIRVNSMHPGTTETDMGDQVLTMRARNLGANDLEPARQQALTRIPIGRMGTVTDIAKGIVFLASDDAAFMTGAGLVVDGGTTAQQGSHALELCVPPWQSGRVDVGMSELVRRSSVSCQCVRRS